MSIQSFLSRAIPAFLFLALAVSSVGCVSQTPVPKYSGDIAVAVFNTHDDNANLSSQAIPDAIAQALVKPIADRNLTVKNIAFENVESQITLTRDTSRRSQILAQTAQNAQILFINEIETEFYSVLSGRYRWNVNVKLSIYDLSTGDALHDAFTIPAVLMYAHEKGDDAINAASADIQRHAGSLVDRFLTGRSVKKNDIKSETAAPAPAGASEQNGAAGGDPPDAAAAKPGDMTSPQAIYFILIDRFFNAKSDKNIQTDPKDPNGWHGGDLEGVRQKLPYLKELGITSIWLSPAFYAASENFFGHGAFHGYWTYDLSQIDPHFGDENDLYALAAEAKKYDISLVLDFVVNHVGYGSPLVETNPEWFHPALTIEDWNDPKQLTERQVHGLPDLNQDNPEVYNYILSAAQKWLNIPNIAGFRLDAVKHVGTDFWKKFNTSLKSSHPDVMLLGEYFDGDPKKTDEMQKAGSFTHLFDFPLAFALRDVYCENKSLANIASAVSNDMLYSHPNNMVTFIDNHDMPRFISLCRNDANRMKLALKTLLSWRGIPSLYYGTETPLSGAKEPDNRADMDFGHPAFYSLIQKGLNLRKAHPVLSFGDTKVLYYEKDFLVLYRCGAGETALVILSQRNTPKSYALPGGKWLSAEDGKSFEGTVQIAPRSVSVYILNREAPIESGMQTITFNIPQDGATYAVTGSLPALGSWNPDKAPQSSSAPISVAIPSHVVVLYKLVKIKNGKHQWSKRDNSELFTDGDKTADTIF